MCDRCVFGTVVELQWTFTPERIQSADSILDRARLRLLSTDEDNSFLINSSNETTALHLQIVLSIITYGSVYLSSVYFTLRLDKLDLLRRYIFITFANIVLQIDVLSLYVIFTTFGAWQILYRPRLYNFGLQKLIICIYIFKRLQF